MPQRHRDVLLLGSFAAPTADDVFTQVSEALGDRISRIPDGETGERMQWIRWQVFAFRENPAFELDPALKGSDYQTDFYRLRPGAAANLSFKPLGYSEHALKSYEALSRLKRAGKVRPETRLQVSIPTPYNVLDRHVTPSDRLAVEPAYERQMLKEIDEMIDAIPASELAIQWDAAHEVQNLERARDPWFENLVREEAEILDRLVRLGDAVREPVELGYHLCYGDFGHRHVVEPTDTELMVRLSNALSLRVKRSIQWVHMPVPRTRTDDAFYAPLKGLKLRPGIKLYLGLVHHGDGVAGTRERIQAAEKVVQDFGIATECGMGRRPPETMAEVLKIHAEVADL